MAVYSLFFTILIALALTNSAFSAEASAEDQKTIEIQINPMKKNINLEIELAKQIALTNSQNSNRNATIAKITDGLILQLKQYLNLYTGDDSCSKTGNFSITNAISRGAQYYANCVNSASTKSLPRIDQLMIHAAAVNAKTAATSIANFFSSCLSRIFSFDFFNVFLGCPSDFINGAFNFMNTTMKEVKNEIGASLSDSVKIAKCADDTSNEAFRVATISLNMYNFCKARLIQFVAITIIFSTVDSTPLLNGLISGSNPQGGKGGKGGTLLKDRDSSNSEDSVEVESGLGWGSANVEAPDNAAVTHGAGTGQTRGRGGSMGAGKGEGRGEGYTKDGKKVKAQAQGSGKMYSFTNILDVGYGHAKGSYTTSEGKKEKASSTTVGAGINIPLVGGRIEVAPTLET